MAGVLIGTAGGYLYYYYVGCASGGCLLSSNPYSMMIYGAIMGFLLFDVFKKEPKKTSESSFRKDEK